MIASGHKIFNRPSVVAGRARVRSSVAALVAGGLLAGVFYTPVWAHAHLDSATPAADSTVRKAPEKVVVSFTEALEKGFSNVAVKDAQGRKVDKGDIDINDKTVSVSVDDLAPGIYTVEWDILSVDTHKTKGSFNFTVKP